MTPEKERPPNPWILMAAMIALAILAAVRVNGADAMEFPEEDADDVMSAADHYLAQRMRTKTLGSRPVYRKEKASRRHDSVTIVIQENTSTEMATETDLQRDSSNDISLGSWLTFGRRDGQFKGTQRGAAAGEASPTLSYSSGRQHTTDSTVARSQRLTGTVTGEVIEVLPNGYLVVESRKRVTVNGETQTLILTGIVNPDHMNSNSEINANYVMDMAVRYDGAGPMSRMNGRGWAAQIVDFLNPF